MSIDRNLLTSIEKIIGTTFNPVNINEDDVVYMLEELVSEYERVEEQLEDLNEDLKENYKPYTKAELYGVSDKDFL